MQTAVSIRFFRFVHMEKEMDAARISQYNG